MKPNGARMKPSVATENPSWLRNQPIGATLFAYSQGGYKWDPGGKFMSNSEYISNNDPDQFHDLKIQPMNLAHLKQSHNSGFSWKHGKFKSILTETQSDNLAIMTKI